MARVDGSLQSLLQGVSQQPARERLPGQCEAQLNMTSNPVDGLGKRAPTQWIDELFTWADNGQWFMYTIDGQDRYLVYVNAATIRVFDLDGVEQTVNSHSLSAYLTTDNMSTVVVDDVMYLANEGKTIAMEDTIREYDEGSALIFLLGGNYGRDYTITIIYKDEMDVEQTITVTHTTPDGSASAHVDDIGTEFIATELETDLNALSEFPGTFTVERKSDVLYIRWTDTDKFDRFDVTVEDGDGGANIFSITDSTDNAAQLPRFAPHNFVVRVAGADASEDDFWLEFLVTKIVEDDTITDGRGTEFGQEGLWVETVSPDVKIAFDKTTMPHTLTREDDDTFTFAQGDWEDRRVGNEDSNPEPSFVGNVIRDMSSFQDRLVIASSSKVIMSRTSKPTDFWSQSATVQADDDPLDIGSASEEASTMRKLTPHNRDLVVWSNEAEFIVFGRNSLTPKNSSLVLTATFEADLNADPVSAGRNVLFATNFGQYTGIQEFFTDGSADINDSRPTTSHVSKFIEGTPIHMAGTSNFSKLFVLTDTDQTVIYTYEYLWQDTEKVQSAWSKWQMPYEVEFFKFIQNEVYIVGKMDGNFILEKLDIDVQDDPGLEYQVKLDQKVYESSVNTTLTAPYDIDADTVRVVQGEGCPNPGMLASIDSIASRTITLKRDMEGGDVILGVKFLGEYVPTQPRVKDRDNVQVNTGSLTVRHFDVTFEKTGHLVGTVTSPYRADQVVKFTGRVTGAITNTVGTQPIVDGTFKIPFGEKIDRATIKISSDHHTPMTILDIGWVGQYNKRGRRITGGGTG